MLGVRDFTVSLLSSFGQLTFIPKSQVCCFEVTVLQAANQRVRIYQLGKNTPCNIYLFLFENYAINHWSSKANPIFTTIPALYLGLMDAEIKNIISPMFEVGQLPMRSFLIQTAMKYLTVFEASCCTPTYMVVLKTYVKRLHSLKYHLLMLLTKYATVYTKRCFNCC